jgi:hypothetical protein
MMPPPSKMFAFTSTTTLVTVPEIMLQTLIVVETVIFIIELNSITGLYIAMCLKLQMRFITQYSVFNTGSW